MTIKKDEYEFSSDEEYSKVFNNIPSTSEENTRLKQQIAQLRQEREGECKILRNKLHTIELEKDALLETVNLIRSDREQAVRRVECEMKKEVDALKSRLLFEEHEIKLKPSSSSTSSTLAKKIKVVDTQNKVIKEGYFKGPLRLREKRKQFKGDLTMELARLSLTLAALNKDVKRFEFEVGVSPELILLDILEFASFNQLNDVFELALIPLVTLKKSLGGEVIKKSLNASLIYVIDSFKSVPAEVKVRNLFL